MNDDFYKMLFLTSPAGGKFLDSLLKQCKEFPVFLQKQYDEFSASLRKQYDEMVKQKCDILKEKFESMQKLNDKVKSELGYK